jgi:hypothetical protein
LNPLTCIPSLFFFNFPLPLFWCRVSQCSPSWPWI